MQVDLGLQIDLLTNILRRMAIPHPFTDEPAQAILVLIQTSVIASINQLVVRPSVLMASNLTHQISLKC
jgi:hypothetical protein